MEQVAFVWAVSADGGHLRASLSIFLFLRESGNVKPLEKRAGAEQTEEGGRRGGKISLSASMSCLTG